MYHATDNRQYRDMSLERERVIDSRPAQHIGSLEQQHHVEQWPAAAVEVGELTASAAPRFGNGSIGVVTVRSTWTETKGDRPLVAGHDTGL